MRFIKVAGGWGVFLRGLRVALYSCLEIRCAHSAVAIRYVLDIPVVSAVIVGTRLSADSSKYIKNNLSPFSLQLGKEDHALIAEAQEELKDIPGDCGDEYRRPPFLTATGDLSHHLGESDERLAVERAVTQGKQIKYCSRSKWEPIAVSETVLLSV